MASKQVQEMKLRLLLEGFEGLDKLKSSFRGLQKAIGPTEQVIEKARQTIIEFGEAGNKSEQLIKGQIEAFKGLRSQATQGGKVYKELAADIKKLEGAAYGASPAVEAQRKALTALGLSADATASQIEQAINSLINLRGEVRVDSQAFDNFGKSIAQLTDRFKEVNQEAQNFAQAQQRIARPIGATSAAARQQIRDLDLVTESLREQRDALGALEGEARIKAGAAGLAERGAPAAGRRTFEEAVSEAAFGGDIKKLLPSKDIKAALDEVAREIADFQQQIETKLSRKIQVSFQETARAGRESARAMAAAFSDPELINVFNQFDKRLGELPDTTTGLNQRLSELSERLANTKRNTVDYLIVAMQMAGVQRELTAVTQGYAQALLMGIRTGTVAPSARNLQEVITALRAEMSQLDVTTSEGARAYAENAREARALEQRLNGLANAYRHVGDMAAQAATAETSAATARVTANYLTRGIVRQQEEAMAELGQRVRAGVAATPLALPAAGQTTAPGTGLPISGEYVQPGYRAHRPEVQKFFARAQVGEAQIRVPGQPVGFGPQATEEQIDRARRAAISEGDAARAVIERQDAVKQAEEQVKSYRAEIDKARKADIGSIESTQRLREAINQYRTTLPGASAEFKKLTKELGELDVRSEKLGRGLTRRRMTGMQMAQAAGAALSGGIFGGPEGFLGGAIGTAVGGVGGAFAGAAIGAQIGGLRKQLGGFADYAAQIQKMEIALKNAAGGQAEFNQAVAAAASATQNLNVPQDIAIQGMTKLTAAVKGAGGQVTDAELVFRNVTSAIKATGGSAEDVDGAITAMVQVFSKGKVSAEELSGQLGERLPGAVTKFAKANDMTLPELQKALEQGQVGLNELMNFIVQLGDEYSGVAEKIAGSSQDAGARLTVAYNNMRIAVGEALQPIGAAFQEAFIPFIEGVTPVLVATLPKIGELMLAIAKNFDTAAVAVGVFMAALAISKVGAAVTALGGIPTVLGLIKVQAIAATGAIQALNLAALVNPWTALAAGVAAVAVAFYDAHKEKQRLDAVMESGSLDQLEAEIKRLEKSIADSESRARGYASELRGVGQDSGYANIELKKTKELLESFKAEYRIRFFIEQTFAGAKGVPQGMRIINGQLAYQVPGQGWVNAQTGEPIKQAATTEFPSLTGDGDRASKAKSEADKAAREAQRAFDERLQKMLQEEDHTLKKFALEEKIRLEREKQGAIQAGTLDSEMQLAEIANQRLDLDVRATALASENAKLEELRKQGLAEGLDVQKIAQKMQQNIIEDLAIQYENQKLNTQEIKAQIDLEKERENLNRALNQELQDRRYELGLITKEEYNRLQIERERRRLEEQYRGLPGAQGRVEEGVDLFRREIDPTFGEGLQSQLAIVRRELDELTKPINQVVGAATAIGDAFSQSFASVINGSATTQEALASFFQNLANYFLDMAAQIIQKMIVLAILNQITGLLPGSKGSDPLKGVGGADWTKYVKANANGNVYAQNGIQPFAMGGIVNKPTLFKYADGGSGRFGLMGEAGPEAIIPLKRGRDGKLGVAGGGGVNVTVNVDAQGTKVQGDNNQGQQLGRAVAAAVQQELIKQKRPGGLLA